MDFGDKKRGKMEGKSGQVKSRGGLQKQKRGKKRGEKSLLQLNYPRGAQRILAILRETAKKRKKTGGENEIEMLTKGVGKRLEK